MATTFLVTHLDGTMETGRLWDLPALLDELDDADIEQPDVSVSDENGWSVGLYASGRIVLEHLEDRDSAPLHLFATRQEQLIAAAAVASERHDLLLDWPWLPGYG
jgi:hypothetical protein